MSNSSIPEIQPYTVEPTNDGMYQEGDYSGVAQPITDQQAVDAQYANVDPYAQQTYDPNAYSYNTTNSELITDQQATERKLPVMFMVIIGVFVVLAILALFLILSSFGSGDTQDPQPGGTGSDQNIVLQWWGAFLSTDVIQPLLDDYKEVRPNVTIEYADRWPGGNYQEAEKTYLAELNRTINTNDSVQLPDIFMVANTWAGDYEQYVQTSTTYDIQTYANTFYQAAVTDFTNQSVIYGVPLWMDTLAIVYNRDLLSEAQLTTPPTSWPRFKNAALALTKKTGNRIDQAGFAAGLGSNVSYGFEMSNLLLAQNGVNFLNEQNQPAFASDPDTVDALSFYKSFAAGNATTWDSTFTNESAAFLEKKVAMIAVPSFRLREIIRLNEANNLGINIGVAQMPQVEGQSSSILNWSNYWGAMVTLNRPNSRAAWEFLTWLSEPEQQRKLSQNVRQEYGYFGTLYPRIDMQEDLREDPYLAVYNQALPNALSWYMVKGMQVKNQFNNLLNSANISTSNVSTLQTNIDNLLVLKGILETTFE